MIKKLKTFIIKIQLAKKKVKIGKKCVISMNSIFKGYNRINNNNKVINSFIGYGTYIGSDCDITNCFIGNFCSISDELRIIRGNHPVNFVSTHPCFYSTLKQSGFTFTNKNKFKEYNYVDENNNIAVKIGNDVWIGTGVKILDGVKIGDGAIIAAGAIVTRNVEPYSIVAGIPARVLRFRFQKKDIDFLLNLKWWEKPLDWINSFAPFFTNIEDLREAIKNDK